MILKRLLSNLIDFLVFGIVYFFIYKLHGFENRPDYSALVLFYTYFIVLVLPILVLKNTIGKKILNLEWRDERLKLKLLLKYFSYFLVFFPSFSILSAVGDFPFWNTNFINLDRSFNLILLLVFIITDAIVYLLSIGRFHVFDYILKLELKGYPYKLSIAKNLAYIYIITGSFLVLNLIQHKYQFSFKHIEKSLGPEFRREHFPEVNKFGVQAFTIRKKANNVLIPSEPASLLFKKELEQKTIYAVLPENYFNSDYYRKEIGYNLLIQSITNDLFSNYNPDQTRLILTNIKREYFGGITTYYYVYYYDNSQPSWRIYGGFDTDSTTIHQYINLTNAFFREQYANPYENISFIVTIDHEKVTFGLDSIYLTLNKIPFEKTDMHGQVRYFFPSTDTDFSLHFTNFLQDQSINVDDKVDELIWIRNNVTDKEL